jgi:flagellar motor switch protein FliN/FliY
VRSASTEWATLREAPTVAAGAALAAHAPAGGGSGFRDASPELGNLEHLLDVRIPLQIRLGSTRMKLEDVLRIAPGAILELDRSEEEPLEVLANGRVIARGQVVVVDERFGLKITEIGTSSERLRAAG